MVGDQNIKSFRLVIWQLYYEHMGFNLKTTCEIQFLPNNAISIFSEDDK